MLYITCKKFCSIRLLLPLSVGCFIFPIFINKIYFIYIFPISYFFAFYFILINFPIISNILYSHPIYIEDLNDSDNSSPTIFKNLYIRSMNIVLAFLFSGFVVYFLLKGFHNKSYIEIIGIIGGIQSLFMRTQNIIGNILLNMCHCIKNRRNSSSSIELLDIVNK